MTPEEIRALLKGVADGSVELESALERLKDGPLRQDELAFATLDHHRHLRQGLAEVVYG
ncbi:MAG: 1-(5-phosphoribosyl)-5-amino-4-imidazole-carboxylate carboxylase, partial [Gemmatimonadetes bacterium]|nr:1-(5-phosphoribosyl)-5-amino-4-imidazole-carboxylate carboxylase [Gemmatimonadota bacterium]